MSATLRRPLVLALIPARFLSPCAARCLRHAPPAQAPLARFIFSASPVAHALGKPKVGKEIEQVRKRHALAKKQKAEKRQQQPHDPLVRQAYIELMERGVEFVPPEGYDVFFARYGYGPDGPVRKRQHAVQQLEAGSFNEGHAKGVLRRANKSALAFAVAERAAKRRRKEKRTRPDASSAAAPQPDAFDGDE